MKRFKKIGLVIHFDKNNHDAIQCAVSHSKLNNAQLYILCAQKTPFTSEKNHIKSVLQAKVAFDYKLIFLCGYPVIEISRFVQEESIDLLIMEPDIQVGLKRFFFGSLALALLRKVCCPVWVVKPSKAQAYKRILICVNSIIENDIEKSLNNKLIEIGTSLAKRESAECHLISVWHLPGESMLSSPFMRTPAIELKRLKAEEKIKVALAFENLQAVNKKHLIDSETHLIYGDPTAAIISFVDKHAVDLVVMGTVARSGVQGFVIGNTAEAIINQLECSIMAIKPDGFVSP